MGEMVAGRQWKYGEIQNVSDARKFRRLPLIGDLAELV